MNWKPMIAWTACSLVILACSTDAGSVSSRPAALVEGEVVDLPSDHSVRADELALLDETEDLPDVHARAAARAALIDQLLRERLEEAGILGVVERDPAGSSAIVEEYLHPLREEFDSTLNPDDVSELERAGAEAFLAIEPAPGDMAALEASLEVTISEGGDLPESIGAYGIDAERTRAAARGAEVRGPR